MKKIILLLIFVCSLVAASGQSISTQTLNISGSSSVVGSVHLEWSVGEMVAVHTLTSTNTMLTQGVLQPGIVFNGPLPVTLLYFTGRADGTHNQLSWATSQEINNDHFDVERSTDGINFQLLKKVPGAGHSSVVKNYSLTDSFPHTNTWYRLKQVDIDEKFSYSNIVRLKQEGRFSLVIYPNPTKGILNISVKEVNKPFQVSIMDVAGRVVQKNSSYMGLISIDVHGLPAGVYYLCILSGGMKESWTGKFVKE